jgi:hypothetical protein
MIVNFDLLLSEHRAGSRCVPVASFRELFCWVDDRTWQAWRAMSGVPKRARLMSRLSALRLWITASREGRVNKNEIRDAITKLTEEKPCETAAWLKSFEWSTKARSIAYSGAEAIRSVMDAINNLAPQVDVIHRRRLYEWFKKAGLRFSVKRSYQRWEILRVVSIALRGVGRGRCRRGQAEAAFF